MTDSVNVSVNVSVNDPVNDYINEAQDLQVHFPITTGLLEKTVSHVKNAGANGGTYHHGWHRHHQLHQGADATCSNPHVDDLSGSLWFTDPRQPYNKAPQLAKVGSSQVACHLFTPAAARASWTSPSASGSRVFGGQAFLPPSPRPAGRVSACAGRASGQPRAPFGCCEIQ